MLAEDNFEDFAAKISPHIIVMNAFIQLQEHSDRNRFEACQTVHFQELRPQVDWLVAQKIAEMQRDVGVEDKAVQEEKK